MPSSTDPSQPQRADAQRNYDAIVAAGRDAFRTHGGGIAFSHIAREAGVGQATLYRHFPGKQELVRAIVDDIVDELEDAAAGGDGDHPAAPLHALVDCLAVNAELVPLMALDQETDWFRETNERILEIVGDTFAACGVELPTDDQRLVFDMMGATAAPTTVEARRTVGRRAVELLLHGLL